MVFDSSTSDHLKPWLTKTLEPMLVLSSLPHLIHSDEFASSLDATLTHQRWPTYILALLKHNAPESELRKELASQLDEFLEKGASPVTPFSSFLNSFACIEGPPFLDALFTTLRTKSYLPI